jgi:hypothetical protein
MQVRTDDSPLALAILKELGAAARLNGHGHPRASLSTDRLGEMMTEDLSPELRARIAALSPSQKQRLADAMVNFHARGHALDLTEADAHHLPFENGRCGRSLLFSAVP